MNILLRNIDALEINTQTLKERMLFYQGHYYDNVYFVDSQGTLKGYLNCTLDCSGQHEVETDVIDASCSIAEVKQWFLSNPGKHRVPVVSGSILSGEYYDSDSNEEWLYKRIEDRALEILSCLNNDLQTWAQNLKVAIIGNSVRTSMFKKLLPAAYVVTSYNEEPDFTIDLLYTPHVRNILDIDNPKILSPSQILFPILIKKIHDYFFMRGIYFYVFDGIKKTDIKNKSEKEIANESSALEEILKDTDYLNTFCGDDKQSLEMLQRHAVDLNQLSITVNNGIYNALVDYSDDGIHFVNGIRKTTGHPKDKNQAIHIFGPCVVQGLCVVDSQTIPSLLQKRVNDADYSGTYVVNHGIAYGKDLLNDMLYMMATPVASHDIIVWINGFSLQELQLIRNIGISVIEDKSYAGNLSNWYLNNPFHCNSVANKEISETIFKYICKQIVNPTCLLGLHRSSLIEDEHIPLAYDKDRLLQSKELDDYITVLRRHRKEDETKIYGCVVVNANPCTNGHIHLIRQALKEVDYLYVFLVEQSCGLFSYLDRELMLKESLKNQDRVEILSGGSVFTTSKGYPGYFNRMGNNTSPLLNHKIFAERIAPTLSISKRFFGEESDDVVTRQLNATALEYLPRQGIKVKIIKRLTYDGRPISAKNVRRLYAEKQYGIMEKLVPQFVYHHLLDLSKE